MNKGLEVKGLKRTVESNSEKVGILINDIDFIVPRGTVLALLGRNGAGKTSIIKLIINVMKREAGEVLFDGKKDIKEDLAYFPDEFPFGDKMSIQEVAQIHRAAFKNWDDNKFNGLIREFKLPENKKFSKFSKGMKQQLLAAVTLSHQATLLILDEPVEGMDPYVRYEVMDKLRNYVYENNASVIISTHITEEIEQFADWIVGIERGKIVVNTDINRVFEEYGIIEKFGNYDLYELCEKPEATPIQSLEELIRGL